MYRMFTTLLCVPLFAFGVAQSNCFAKGERAVQENVEDNSNNNSPEQIRTRQASYRKELAKQLDVAFAQLESTIKLTADKEQAIAEALEKDLNKLAKKRAKMARTFIDYQVPLELQARLLEELKVHGCDAKEIESFGQLIEAKRKFIERLAKESLVRILDEYFILSGDQIETLKNVQKEHWTPRIEDRALQAEAYSWHSPMELFQDISGHLPKDFLKPKQKELLESYEEFSVVALRKMASSIRKGIAAAEEEEEDIHDETYRKWLSHSFALKIDEIDELCELTESQRKKLAVIEKGVIGQIVKRRDELIETVVKNMNNRGGAARRGSSMDAAVEFARSPNQAIDSCKRWIDTIPKTLDENQLSKMEAYWQARKDRGYRCRIECGVLSLTKLANGIHFDQQKQLVERLLQAASSGKPIPKGRSDRGYYTNNQLLTLIPDEDYEEILTESQWSKLRPLMTRRRNR